MITTVFCCKHYTSDGDPSRSECPRKLWIRFDGVPEGKACVPMQPVLKLYLETEAGAQMLLEKLPEILRANPIRSNDFIEGARNLPILLRLFP